MTKLMIGSPKPAGISREKTAALYPVGEPYMLPPAESNMGMRILESMRAAVHGPVTLALCVATLLPTGCGIQSGGTGASADTVLASVINVTPYTVTVVLSGILGDAVDTVRETVGPIDSVDVPFVCIDELVVGDPLEPAAPGVTIDREGEVEEIAPFSIPAAGRFRCGDVIEIIVSGVDPDSFAVDVFAFTPP